MKMDTNKYSFVLFVSFPLDFDGRTVGSINPVSTVVTQREAAREQDCELSASYLVSRLRSRNPCPSAPHGWQNVTIYKLGRRQLEDFCFFGEGGGN